MLFNAANESCRFSPFAITLHLGESKWNTKCILNRKAFSGSNKNSKKQKHSQLTSYKPFERPTIQLSNNAYNLLNMSKCIVREIQLLNYCNQCRWSNVEHYRNTIFEHNCAKFKRKLPSPVSILIPISARKFIDSIIQDI